MTRKDIPNIVSMSRLVIFGPLVALCKITGLPLEAFIFGCLGVSTDMLDGYLAERLDAKSDEGKQWIDPVCDYGFSALIIIGFSWENGDFHLARALIGGGLLLSAAILKLRKEREQDHVHHFLAGFLPAYYSISAIIYLYLYADGAFMETGMKVINAITLPLVALAAWCKWNRICDWWRDLTVWAKKRFRGTTPSHPQ